jgi:hypothetical protein
MKLETTRCLGLAHMLVECRLWRRRGDLFCRVSDAPWPSNPLNSRMRSRLIVYGIVSTLVAALTLGAIFIPDITGLAVGFFKGLFSIFILCILAFAGLLVTFRTLSREALIVSFCGAALLFIFACGISIYGYFVPESAHLPEPIVASRYSRNNADATERRTKSKTLYLDNYRFKGDSPKAIRCEEVAGEMECHGARSD